MKLRNKKTGEIDDYIFEVITDRIDLYRRVGHSETKNIWHYNSLAELNEEWEDYEEPKEHWYIECDGEVYEPTRLNQFDLDRMENIGNHFKTKEEAEKACEKLKAWKRLKDKGFRFDKWTNTSAGPYSPVWFYFRKDTKLEDVKADLDLLFGGGE